MANPRYAWPIEIGALNKDLSVVVNGNRDTCTFVEGSYWWSGDGGANDFAAAFEAALMTHGVLGGGTFTVALEAGGTVNVTFDLQVHVDLEFSHANTTVTPAYCGFGSAVYGGGVFGVSTPDIDSPYYAGHTWYPDTLALDDREVPVLISRHFEGVGPQGEPVVYGEWSTTVHTYSLVEPIRVLQYHADDATDAAVYGITQYDPNVAAENLIRDIHAEALGLYYYPSGGSTPEWGPYYLWGDRPDMRQWIEVEDPAGVWYRVKLFLKR